MTTKVSCHFYPLKARLQLFQGITPLKVGLTNPVVVTIRQLVEKGQLMDDPVFHVVIGKAAPDKRPLLVFILVIIHIAGIDNIGLVGADHVKEEPASGSQMGRDLAEGFLDVRQIIKVAERVRIAGHRVKLGEASQVTHVGLNQLEINAGFGSVLARQAKHFWRKISDS